MTIRVDRDILSAIEAHRLEPGESNVSVLRRLLGLGKKFDQRRRGPAAVARSKARPWAVEAREIKARHKAGGAA